MQKLKEAISNGYIPAQHAAQLTEYKVFAELTVRNNIIMRGQ